MLEAVDVGSPERAHTWFDENLSLDDLLWQQSVSSFRYLTAKWIREDKTPDERILYRLIRRGLVDIDDRDKAFPMNTRSMRYSACVADRLWTLLERERIRV